MKTFESKYDLTDKCWVPVCLPCEICQDPVWEPEGPHNIRQVLFAYDFGGELKIEYACGHEGFRVEEDCFLTEKECRVVTSPRNKEHLLRCKGRGGYKKKFK